MDAALREAMGALCTRFAVSLHVIGRRMLRCAERLQLLPGISTIASATLLAIMPELGHQSD